MSITLKPYPEYKDSGLSWLGEIPKHWSANRLKRVCRLGYGDSLPSEARLSGDVPVYGSNGRVGYHNAPNTLGPCIIVGRKGSFGKVNYSLQPDFAIDTTFFVDGRLTKENLRWLYYVLSWVRLDDASRDSAIPGLDRGEAYERIIPIAPMEEQHQIAAFLDSHDHLINRIIRAKRRLIELLNEQKQVIIHRAVTRGLDPNVRLKPSGIDWLGDVPEHWEIARCGQLFREVVDIGHPNCELLSIDRFRGVIRQAETGRKERASEDRSCYKRVRCGELAYNLMNAFMGSIGISPLDGILSPAYAVARPKRMLNPEYFHRLFRTRLYTTQFDRYSYGIMYERNRLYFDRFKVIPALVPPLEEQEKIVNNILRETAQLEKVVAKAEHEIALLREYRTRLIADVVTGKLDVRGVELPALDEADALEEWETGEDAEAGEMDEIEGFDA
jgi:type I restriction enzyme S subunit